MRTTLVGFALAGLGVATLIPAVYARLRRAARPADPPPRVELAAADRLPAAADSLGAIADATQPAPALPTVVAAGLGTVVLGRVLRATVTTAPPRDARTPTGAAPWAPEKDPRG